MWWHIDVTIFDVTKADAISWRVISLHFWTWKKIIFLNFWLWAHLAYKLKPIKIIKEQSNLNIVKISFRKVAVPLIKFTIKDVKISQKFKKMATLLAFSAL